LILYLYTKNLLNGVPYDPLKAEILVKNRELQNQVDQFWNCFNTSIKMNKRGPDGIKRTSFMARLANGQYIYRNDLGGLCSICNEYFYEVFDTLTSLIRLNITDQGEKVT